jgi:hypothetical protein
MREFQPGDVVMVRVALVGRSCDVEFKATVRLTDGVEAMVDWFVDQKHYTSPFEVANLRLVQTK